MMINQCILFFHPPCEELLPLQRKTGITTRHGCMPYAFRSSRLASGAPEIRQSSTKAMSLQAPYSI